MRCLILYFAFILSLLSCSLSAPTPSPNPAPLPQPIDLEIHWQAHITGSTPKTKDQKADLERLRTEIKSTLKLMKALVRRAHVDKDPEARKILHELANPEASITTMYNFIKFFERYVLRIYEFNFENTGDRKKTLAHISAGAMSDRMSISEMFWQRSIEEQVGTIFHEVSHRGGTVDWWKETSDGRVVPMKQEPNARKEGKGLLMGYRHKSYWTIYNKCGSKFLLNADFWYTFAIFVRRMAEGHTGDDRYPISVRRSHPTMSQHLTPPMLAAAHPDPVPTDDNDSFEGVILAEEQFPYYDQQHIPFEEDPGEGSAYPRPPSRTNSVKSGSSVRSGSIISSAESAGIAGSRPPSPGLPPADDHAHYDPAHYDPAHHDPAHYDPTHYDPTHYDPTHYDPTHYDPTHYDHAHEAPPASHAGPAKEQPAEDVAAAAASSSKKKGKKKESALTNFMLGGSGRKRKT